MDTAAAPPVADVAATSTIPKTSPVPNPADALASSTLRQRKPAASCTESDAYRADDEAGDVPKPKPTEEVTWGKTPSGTGE